VITVFVAEAVMVARSLETAGCWSTTAGTAITAAARAAMPVAHSAVAVPGCFIEVAVVIAAVSTAVHAGIAFIEAPIFVDPAVVIAFVNDAAVRADCIATAQCRARAVAAARASAATERDQAHRRQVEDPKLFGDSHRFLPVCSHAPRAGVGVHAYCDPDPSREKAQILVGRSLRRGREAARKWGPVFSPKIAAHVRDITSGCEPAPLARDLPAAPKLVQISKHERCLASKR
jgi:hypothetical protein